MLLFLKKTLVLPLPFGVVVVIYTLLAQVPTFSNYSIKLIIISDKYMNIYIVNRWRT